MKDTRLFEIVYDVGPEEARVLQALPENIRDDILEARRLDNQQMVLEWTQTHPGKWMMTRMPVPMLDE
jgi:hypothetical protein